MGARVHVPNDIVPRNPQHNPVSGELASRSSPECPFPVTWGSSRHIQRGPAAPQSPQGHSDWSQRTPAADTCPHYGRATWATSVPQLPAGLCVDGIGTLATALSDRGRETQGFACLVPGSARPFAAYCFCLPPSGSRKAEWPSAWQLTCVWIRLRPRNQRIWPLRSSRSAWSISSSPSASSSSVISSFPGPCPASFRHLSWLVGIVAMTWGPEARDRRRGGGGGGHQNRAGLFRARALLGPEGTQAAQLPLTMAEAGVRVSPHPGLDIHPFLVPEASCLGHLCLVAKSTLQRESQPLSSEGLGFPCSSKRTDPAETGLA